MVILLAMMMTMAAPLDERGLIDAVVEAHPEVKAAAARALALDEGALASLTWADPMIGVEYSSVPIMNPVLNGDPMSGLQLTLTQTIPFPGKLAAHADAGRAAAAAERATALEARTTLITQVRRRVVALRRAEATHAAITDHRTALGRLLDVVRLRYELGTADQYNLLRLQLFDDKLAEQQADLVHAAKALRAELNAMAARSADDDIDVGIDNPSSGDLPPSSGIHRPMLGVLEGRADAARLRADAVAIEVLPDLTTWIGYRIRLPSGPDPGDNLVSAGLSIPMPFLWGQARLDRRAAAERATAEAIDNARASLLRSLEADVQGGRVRFARANARARAYGDTLIPHARDTLQAALTAYQVGRASFVDLFEAEREVIDLQQAAIDARAEAATARIDVEAATTLPFTAPSITAPSNTDLPSKDQP